ncbi:hypothetical protein Ahy_B03g066191 isoform A [Arachis hypogaea]|uniref:Uncharacterized protein n=1 Tax=Arachis hypogaea TaxID=3818 RepID=A0A445A3E3_ARAHY|nr:hypothetical protein Ahy_B03g066191 isoform A [Arachis hypogaea]
MPCKHLQLHNLYFDYPYELPIDDPNYENRNPKGTLATMVQGLAMVVAAMMMCLGISLRCPFGSGGSPQKSGDRGWGSRQENLD